jgi:hypothetical protein
LDVLSAVYSAVYSAVESAVRLDMCGAVEEEVDDDSS